MIMRFKKNTIFYKKLMEHGRIKAGFAILLGYLQNGITIIWDNMPYVSSSIYSTLRTYSPGFTDEMWWDLQIQENSEMERRIKDLLCASESGRHIWEEVYSFYTLKPDVWQYEDERHDLVKLFHNKNWSDHSILLSARESKDRLNSHDRKLREFGKQLDVLQRELKEERQGNVALGEQIRELQNRGNSDSLSKASDDSFSGSFNSSQTTLRSPFASRNPDVRPFTKIPNNSFSSSSSTSTQSLPTHLTTQKGLPAQTISKAKMMFGKSSPIEEAKTSGSFRKPQARPLEEMKGLLASESGGLVIQQRRERQTGRRREEEFDLDGTVKKILSNLTWQALKGFSKVLYMDYQQMVKTLEFLTKEEMETLSGFAPWAKTWYPRPTKGDGYEIDYPEKLQWNPPLEDQLEPWCDLHLKWTMFHPYDAEILFRSLWELCGSPKLESGEPGISLMYSHRYPRVLTSVTICKGVSQEVHDRIQEMFNQAGYSRTTENNYGTKIDIIRESLRDFAEQRILFLPKFEKVDFDEVLAMGHQILNTKPSTSPPTLNIDPNSTMNLF